MLKRLSVFLTPFWCNLTSIYKYIVYVWDVGMNVSIEIIMMWYTDLRNIHIRWQPNDLNKVHSFYDDKRIHMYQLYVTK